MNPDNNTSNYYHYGRDELENAIDIWKTFGLFGKHLKKYVTEPNAFKVNCREWSGDGMSQHVILYFHIKVLELFLTYVVIDLINDNLSRFNWKKLTVYAFIFVACLLFVCWLVVIVNY